MRALKFIRGHVIFKLRYNQIYQLKTTYDIFRFSISQFLTNLYSQNVHNNFLEVCSVLVKKQTNFDPQPPLKNLNNLTDTST